MANAIHRWAHQTQRKNGCVVTLLQDLWIIQRRQEHAKHHMGLQNTHYAPITNLLNPILDGLSFWRRLERILEALCRTKARRFPPRTH